MSAPSIIGELNP